MHQLALFYVECEAGLECDFVLAFNRRGVRHLIREMYGHGTRVDSIELVKEIATELEALWLGPDHPLLAELGGTRTELGPFPRWTFDGREFGRTKSYD